MKAIQYNGQILQGIPPVWNNTFNYRSADQSVWFNDGWRDVITPPVTDIQRLGAIFFDNVNDVFTYPVIDLTEAEIQARVASQAEGARQEALNQKLLAQADESFQAIDTDGEALENQSAFPLWSSFADGHTFALGFKVQDFEGVELKLYRVIQSHAKQANWFPSNVPALFVKVLAEGGPLIWEAGIEVTVGQEYLYTPDGNTYIVVQSHTTQEIWTPPTTPALWELKP